MLPPQGFSEELKWSEVISIKGAGATNCGKERITNEAWDKCEAWAKSEQGKVVKDIELYNIATETDKGTSWDPQLKCSFHANVKCGYAIEGKAKLQLKGRLKSAGADAGCDAPPPSDDKETLVIGQCADDAAAKKTPPPKKPAAVKKAVVAAAAKPSPPSPKSGAEFGRSKLLRIKGANLPSCGIDKISSEVWRKCEMWAAKKTELGGSPLIENVELYWFTMKPLGETGCSYEAAVKCLHTQDRPAAVPAAASSTVKPSVPLNKGDGPEFVDSNGMRWSSLIDIEGAGITNCGENRIKNEAWDKCEEWITRKKTRGQLRPTLKDVELYNIASEDHKGPSWAPQQSCTFHATLKCGYKME